MSKINKQIKNRNCKNNINKEHKCEKIKECKHEYKKNKK